MSEVDVINQDGVQVEDARLAGGRLCVSGRVSGAEALASQPVVSYGALLVQIADHWLDRVPGRIDTARGRRFAIDVDVGSQVTRSYLRTSCTGMRGEQSHRIWPVNIERAQPSEDAAEGPSRITGLLLSPELMLFIGTGVESSQMRLETSNGIVAPEVGGRVSPRPSSDPAETSDEQLSVETGWALALLGESSSVGDRAPMALRDPATGATLPYRTVEDQTAVRFHVSLLSSALGINDAVNCLSACLSRLRASSPSALWLAKLLIDQIERLPGTVDVGHPRVLLHCDSATRVADVGIVLRGWFHFGSEDVLSVELCDGRHAVRIDEEWCTESRGDVALHLKNLGVRALGDQHGFTSFVSSSDFSIAHYLAVTSRSGFVTYARLPEVSLSASLPAIREVLSAFSPASNRLLRRMSDEIGPVVGALWNARRKPLTKPYRRDFGSVPARPPVSIIVPLYGRADLIEYQMASLADDPEIHHQQLIYFLDDPRMFDDLADRCRDLFEIYRIPFTFLYAGANLGYAGANNAALESATGSLVLLLNSDVLPKNPGWLGQLSNCYRSQDNCGVLGAKLLYEDGSVQHAGMQFRRHEPWLGWWINEHPCKGQSGEPLRGLQDVDAVTGACALVDAQLLRELGGLDEAYIIGDFEDSDLCLKALRAGRKNKVLLDVELYHFERMSQSQVGDARWRSNLSLYNCWLHDQRWSSQIASLHP